MHSFQDVSIDCWVPLKEFTTCYEFSQPDEFEFSPWKTFTSFHKQIGFRHFSQDVKMFTLDACCKFPNIRSDLRNSSQKWLHARMKAIITNDANGI
jgi:hypothetical protein